jgi:eukaryotic-like serine/threonine-protein kinase
MSIIPLASRLEGLTIDNWKIIKKRIKTKEDHSGAFSSGYEVKNIKDNRLGFLKAMNYQYAFSALKPGVSSTVFLEELTANYNYEKELLELCNEKRMSRIVAAIGYGEYTEAGEMFPVPYLIFEIADDSLKNIKSKKSLDRAWKLGAIHGFLVGLSQLHKQKIVHQDIKPSNILIFGKNASKLSDLGNATRYGKQSPMWNGDGHCGDKTYAPIELLYHYCSPHWETRRLGADLFMAGGIITYLFTDSTFLSLLAGNLPETYKPYRFGGSFEEVKPHLMVAYYKTLAELEDKIDMPYKIELIEIIGQLSHPIPEERGLPKGKGFFTSLRQYSLDRYISIIDRLAKKVELIKT